MLTLKKTKLSKCCKINKLINLCISPENLELSGIVNSPVWIAKELSPKGSSKKHNLYKIQPNACKNYISSFYISICIKNILSYIKKKHELYKVNIKACKEIKIN